MNKILFKKQGLKIVLFLCSVVLTFLAVTHNKLAYVIPVPVITAFIFWDNKKSTSTVGYEVKPEVPPNQNKQVLFCAYLFYALVASLVTLFIAGKYPASRLAFIPWGISVLLLTIAALVHDKIKPLGWFQRVKTFDPDARKKILFEIGVVVALTIAAFILRFYKLETVPPMVHGDEGEFGMDALRVLGIGDPLNPFGVGWMGHPSLFAYLMAIGIKLFGADITGLRFCSVIFGTACIPLIYLVGRKFWGNVAGITAAWLATVSHFFIHYSRLAMNNIATVTFLIATLLLLLLPAKEKNEEQHESLRSEPKKSPPLLLFVVIGILLGLSQYMAQSSRFIPIIALIPILILLFQKKIKFSNVLLMAFSALIVFAPMIQFYIKSPESLLSRANYVSIFNPETISRTFGQGVTLQNHFKEILLGQITKNFGFFLRGGDVSPFYYANIAALDPFIAILFWLGFGVVIGNVRRLPDLSIFLWFTLGLILAGFINVEPPSGSRLLVIVPVVFLMGGIVMQKTWDAINGFYQKYIKTTYSLVPVLIPVIILFFAGTLWYNANEYFVHYVRDSVFVLSSYLGREIKAQFPKNHVYLMGDRYIYSYYGTLRYFTQGELSTDILTLDQIVPLTDDGKGLAILAVGDHMDELEKNAGLFPFGTLKDFTDYKGYVLFTELIVPPKK